MNKPSQLEMGEAIRKVYPYFNLRGLEGDGPKVWGAFFTLGQTYEQTKWYPTQKLAVEEVFYALPKKLESALAVVGDEEPDQLLCVHGIFGRDGLGCEICNSLDTQELPSLDVKNMALEMFIEERMTVAKDWGVPTKGFVSKQTLDGIDAEVNDRLRIRLIEALSRLSAMEKENHWISVEHELPPMGRLVIVSAGKVVQMCLYSWNGEDNAWSPFDEDFDCAPADTFTHWRPLPSPPKEALDVRRDKNGWPDKPH